MPVVNIKFSGFDELTKKLENLSAMSSVMIGDAIYEGAKVIGDAQKHALMNLKTDDRQDVEIRSSIRKIEKKGLIESFGIAPIRDDSGFINVKTGFDGYNEMKTKDYPNGKPNLMVARSLESGTSFMPKNPIFTQQAKLYTPIAEAMIENSLLKQIDDLTK